MSTPDPHVARFEDLSVSAFSVATRVAGVVIALGYLLGLVPGPVVAVVGGLALTTFGRNLLLERTGAVVAGAALAVLGGALGIAALRWGALDLGDIRGVQSVLGPTVLVGPTQAAAASIVATAGATLALAVWCSRPWPTTRRQLIWWALELGVGAFAVATVFLDPAESALGAGEAGDTAIQISRWVGVIVASAAVTGGIAWLLDRTNNVWRGVAVIAAGAAVVTSAGLLLSVT